MTAVILPSRILAIIVVALILSPAALANLPRVSTDGVTWEGQWDKPTGVASFRGIPFAQAPVGELRWKKARALPVPDASPRVSGTVSRPAHEFAPACMQTMRILDWYRDLAELFGAPRSAYKDITVSEDCLYLNIWTPTLKPEQPVPVMVWIHGGSNNSGWSYEPSYHGQALAAEGVVVISIAYRVGVFGFFSPPGLNAAEGLANFGLWDQVTALQWIQRNIAAFGGDPQRVTLFGESSGAENITTLMYSRPAQELFQRVILESTPPHDGRAMPTLATEAARGSAFAKAQALKPGEALAALREMPAAELFARYQDQFGTHRHYPVIDGQLLLRNEWQDIDDGVFPIQHMLIGNNANEAYAYLPASLTQAQLVQRIADTRYLDNPETHALLAGETNPRRALDRLLTADAYACHSQAFANGMNQAGGQAWVYRFSRAREGPGGEAWGAYHGTEYPYVFNSHESWLHTTAIDREITRQVMAHWVDFARNGDPNGSATLNWPEFQGTDPLLMDFNDSISVTTSPDAALCKIYQAQRAAASYQATP